MKNKKDAQRFLDALKQSQVIAEEADGFYAEDYLDEETSYFISALGCENLQDTVVGLRMPLASAMRLLRKRFGIAINVTAHDGGCYTTDIVYLNDAPEGLVVKGLEDNAMYGSYEAGAQNAIAVVVGSIFEDAVNRPEQYQGRINIMNQSNAE